MKHWDKKHYVIPSEYNERGNPQNKNFLVDAHVSPLGFLSMTQNFWIPESAGSAPMGRGNPQGEVSA